MREDARVGAGVGAPVGREQGSGRWSVLGTHDGSSVGTGTVLGSGRPNVCTRWVSVYVSVVVPGGRREGTGAKSGACGGQVTFWFSGVVAVGARRMGPSFIH